MEKTYQKIVEYLEQKRPFTKITLIEAKGSVPQVSGATMLVTQESTNAPTSGTIGGGKVEKDAITHALSMMKNHQKTDLLSWNLKKDVGMTCGGQVQIFFEVFESNSWHISLFGAGHVAQSLVPILLTLDCEITVIDSRQDWLDKFDQHKKLTTIFNKTISDEVHNMPENSFFICMTHGHIHDLPVITQVYKREKKNGFIGVIGSRSKSNELRAGLKKEGISQELIDTLICPIGFPIGNNTPSEIAISIVAQLLEKRDS